VKKTLSKLLVVVAVATLCGCHKQAKLAPDKPHSDGKVFFAVDFKPNQKLTYKFTSRRTIKVNWSGKEGGRKNKNQNPAKFSESMEMVVTYTGLEVNPFGLSVIRAKINSVKARRSQQSSITEPIKTLTGKTFTFTVWPNGKIDDYSQLKTLIKKLGAKAFKRHEKRIKESDMIDDFIATQWFLWDAVSSIEEPSEGVMPGQTWNSKLIIPGPMVMRKALNVTYKLAEISLTKKGKIALIKSTFAPSKTVPSDWPMPYEGSFRMAGTFGFLRGYSLENARGKGQQIFNLDNGRIQKDERNYTVELKATMPFIATRPKITIEQSLNMKLVSVKEPNQQ